MAAVTPADQILLDLQDTQIRLMKLAVANEPVSSADLVAISDAIGACTERIRRVFARTAKAIRGED